jgi:hypothetical protein
MSKEKVENQIQQDKPKRQRSKGYSKNKGNRYEAQIAKELRDLGFTGCKTSRSESKSADDNKIDIIDTENKLPINIQLKKTQSIPSYFKIRSESSSDPKKFCIIWAKQEKKETNICTVGECAIISKELLYELIKSYASKD